MRSLVVAALVALSPWLVNANESFIDAAPAAADIATFDPAATVVVTPIPAPARVTELLDPMNSGAKIRPAKKLKVAKKKPLPTLLLSRTERHQMALLGPKPKAGDPPIRIYVNDEESDSGYDNLAFHVSFARPKVYKEAGEDEDVEFQDISDAVKLRLFMARMKAIEAHASVRAADLQGNEDAGLSEAAKLRLFLARMKAVEAHQKKFS